ncbi:MAG: hypothetical protein NWR20_05315 [Schleiferiaceae bacterium]|nr:hypothetical protein [Schleiferiaceae bacterium]
MTCRDQIARLKDLNGDGETDFIECFNDDAQVTEHFHEFAMGLQTDAATPQEPVSFEYYFIVTDKCTECVGFHETPQCAEVCPVDCCVPDEDHVESREQLEAKKSFLHLD